MNRVAFLFFIVLLTDRLSFAQDSLMIKKTGTYFGIGMGTWFPDNNNRKLGCPSILHVTLIDKRKSTSTGLSFDIIGWPVGKTREPITVKFGDSLVTSNECFGGQLTLDFYHDLLEANRFLLEGMCSAGVGRLEYYNPDADTHVGRTSLVLAPGISLKYYPKKGQCFHLRSQYYIANYRLKDNVSTKLNGNFLAVKLLYEGIR